MKRLLSILFAAILLFSLCGYGVVIGLLQRDADQAITSVINEETYGQDNLVSLKVPVSLPYYTNSEQFQHISGEISIDGNLYRYVKRRIYQDSIEYLCLRDPESTRLQGARDQFFQLAYNLEAFKNGKAKQQHTIKPLMLEYCPQPDDMDNRISPPSGILAKCFKSSLGAVPFSALPGQPPEQENFLS